MVLFRSDFYKCRGTQNCQDFRVLSYISYLQKKQVL